MKKFFTQLLLLFTLISVIIPLSIYSQSDTDKSLKEAKELNIKALTVAANIFAEDEFDNGIELLAEAEKLIKKNGSPEEIQKSLSSCIESFNKAIEKSKTLNASFTDLMKTRQMALSVGGNESAEKLWKEGEGNFASAVDDYNDKDTEGYQKYAKAAEANYKDAELSGIKGRFINSLNISIEQAEDKDIKKYAPLTLKKCKDLAQEIETIIDANRYDTAKARINYNQAMYELNHGLYLLDLFKKMSDKDKTTEDLVLSWEEPLTKIGAEFKIQPSFDKGYDEITTKIISNVNDNLTKLENAKKENQRLNTELEASKKTIQDYKTKLTEAETQNNQFKTDSETLKKSIDDLNKMLEDYKDKFTKLESESSKYKTQSEELERNTQTIENVSKLFSPSEAEVTRNGDLIIIRLVNIVFPTGKATLEPQYFNLLAKVQKALQQFPNGTFVIEGHTDGQGDYQKNLDLSQQRANAVFQYFMSSIGAEASKITTAGLGGTKPIANNSTEEGRAKNRRIEIVINPHFIVTK